MPWTMINLQFLFEVSCFCFVDTTQNLSKSSTNFRKLYNFGDLHIPPLDNTAHFHSKEFGRNNPLGLVASSRCIISPLTNPQQVSSLLELGLHPCSPQGEQQAAQMMHLLVLQTAELTNMVQPKLELRPNHLIQTTTWILPPTPPVGPPPDLVCKSNRQKTVPANLQDYICNTVWNSHSSNPHTTFSAISSKSCYPLTQFIDYEKLSPAHWTFLASVTTDVELTRYSEAIFNPK